MGIDIVPGLLVGVLIGGGIAIIFWCIDKAAGYVLRRIGDRIRRWFGG